MPAQPDLSKLSVTQFAERFRGEMIPLSNTFSYFCASVPMSEEDLKEYLEEPVAALPPTIAQALRAHGCTNVTTGVIEGSSHYVADEQPAIVEEFIDKYASPQDQSERKQ